MRPASIGVYELIDGPASEPVTLAEAKLHARIDIDDDDDLVTALITTARQWVEQTTGRCLMTQQWKLTLDNWPASIRDEWWDGVRDGPITTLEANWVDLRKSPVVSIDEVSKREEDGVEVVWDASNYYQSMQPNGFARLTRKRGVIWPIVIYRVAGAIQIKFTCGYGSNASDVPFPIRQAIKMLVAHWYETREPNIERGAPVPFTVTAALAPYRVAR